MSTLWHRPPITAAGSGTPIWPADRRFRTPDKAGTQPAVLRACLHEARTTYGMNYRHHHTGYRVTVTIATSVPGTAASIAIMPDGLVQTDQTVDLPNDQQPHRIEITISRGSLPIATPLQPNDWAGIASAYRSYLEIRSRRLMRHRQYAAPRPRCRADEHFRGSSPRKSCRYLQCQRGAPQTSRLLNLP